MQFSTVLVAITTFAMALASPVEVVRRTDPTGKCEIDQEAKCCDGITNNLVSLATLTNIPLVTLLTIPVLAQVPIGVGCVQVPVGGCNNKAACCSGDQQNVQNGLVNVNLDLDCTQVL